MKQYAEKIALFFLCFSFILSSLIIPIPVSAETTTTQSISIDKTTASADDTIKDVTFAPGKDQSQLNFTWYSKSTSETQVQVALKSDMSGSEFPVDKAQTFNGEKSNGNDRYTSNKVTVTGLKQGVEYVYRVGDGTN
ncbi:fibronectin type III domain-containing protein [Clostridium kluyveri]|uniref:Purple acid phosphatase N-terminal domain-containing protein n=1 Tax=Clostridium kluyveri (strain ATCC 8527 / DSM 555 / NBRC 12016 / NCIMB 10680 / K1) TaxID=431943 RepID=A5N8V9_CLOK5|nr:fibronectin type III domain-containing protein [Clostridium kluyveri]EDK33740.1 Conserved hypothetical protein [Clostridium kluyveri DSM 555]